jgi:hypothetical protein
MRAFCMTGIQVGPWFLGSDWRPSLFLVSELAPPGSKKVDDTLCFVLWFGRESRILAHCDLRKMVLAEHGR